MSRNQHKSSQEEALRRYLDSVRESASRYERGELELKEYLRYVEESDKKFKERCDADSR